MPRAAAPRTDALRDTIAGMVLAAERFIAPDRVQATLRR